jgi:hypothetical protein
MKYQMIILTYPQTQHARNKQDKTKVYPILSKAIHMQQIQICQSELTYPPNKTENRSRNFPSNSKHFLLMQGIIV